MDRIAATIAGIGIAASLALGVPPAASDPVDQPAEPGPRPSILRAAIAHDVPKPAADRGLPVRDAVSIVGGTAGDQGLVDSAIDHYRDAGLALPSLVVTIDRSGAACKGHNGLYRATGDGDEIAICHPSEYVILHELAHAWERHALDDVDRSAYVREYDLPSWSDPDTPWRLRGIEHIANTLAAALRGDGSGCSGAVAERYGSLTGLDCPIEPTS